jgi:hypothetical protein
MVVFEKKAVIVRLRQMFFQQARNQGKYFFKFRIAQVGNQVLHQGVVGKFLQIEQDGFFIGLTVKSKTHKALVGLDKIMGMDRFICFLAIHSKSMADGRLLSVEGMW